MNRTTILALILLLPLALAAQVRLPSILSSGMVLQRDTVVNIWGWAAPGEEIEVAPGWLSGTIAVKARSNGTWLISVPTGPAGGPHSILITGKNRIKLTNILFGEVWICSGQSNMEYTIRGLGGWKQYKKEKTALKKNDFSAIRLCTIEHAPELLPSDSCRASWCEATPATAADFSATGFFFGWALYKMLNIPIGLISSAIGGTPAEAWTARECIGSDPELAYFLRSPNGESWDCAKVSRLYNGMIHPLMNYAIKGVIWYQGESNRHDADRYQKLFSTMIGCWRNGWKQGNFPFYFVQIAPFNYGESYGSAAYLREAQQQSLSVPNTGMVVTMDIGDNADIHPKNKQDVGLRLAKLAMSKTYGKSGIQCTGPVFSQWKNEGGQVRVYFNNAADGLISNGDRIKSFTLAGNDGIFHEATARIDGSTVLLGNNLVKDPLMIRFAFTDTSTVNLFNRAGLPAAPFRTDTIPLLIRPLRLTTEKPPIADGRAFRFYCPDTICQVRYTLDGTDPVLTSAQYTSPVRIDKSAPIRARVCNGRIISEKVFEFYYKSHSAIGKKITMDHPPAEKYNATDDILVDGLRGSTAFQDGRWQGYEGGDFVGTIDLGATTLVKKATIGFLNDTKSWIFLPEYVKIFVSSDGNSYREVSEIITAESPEIPGPSIREYQWNIPESDKRNSMSASGTAETRVRFIRIYAKNRGVCPRWHPGKGGRAWLFADEIMVE
jgi:sialate O-acetylesterase